MTNHLMGGHASPTALTIGAHSGQPAKHFVAVGYIKESFHFRKATLHIQRSTRRKCFILQPRPKSRLGFRPHTRSGGHFVASKARVEFSRRLRREAARVRMPRSSDSRRTVCTSPKRKLPEPTPRRENQRDIKDMPGTRLRGTSLVV